MGIYAIDNVSQNYGGREGRREGRGGEGKGGEGRGGDG